MPKPAGTFRIVCLGGSTTYDVKIEDYTKAYPAQLQSELGKLGFSAEVVNAGFPAWTSREQVLNYVTRVSYMEPDMIVYFEPINDLLLRATWPPERLRSDYTSPWVLVPEYAKPAWYMSLTLFRVPLILAGYELPAQTAIPKWSDIARNQGTDNVKWAFGGDDLRHPKEQVRTIPSGKTLKDVFAVMPTDYFANNVSSIISCAKQRHTMVLLVSGMLDWETLKVSGGDRAEGGEGGEGLRYGVAQMNEVLAKLAKEQSVFYHDLAGEWPDNSSYWADPLHNNEAGAHVKAELIAKHIVNMNLASAAR